MSLAGKDIAAIVCGAFLVVCCAVVMLIHLCRPELLNPKLKETQSKEDRPRPQGQEAPASPIRMLLDDL